MKTDENGKLSFSKYLRDRFRITVLTIANSYIIFNWK